MLDFDCPVGFDKICISKFEWLIYKILQRFVILGPG